MIYLAVRATVCPVCDKVGRLVKGSRNSIPAGWRRVTLSNPDSLVKRGITGVVCSPGCACKHISQAWNEREVIAA